MRDALRTLGGEVGGWRGGWVGGNYMVEILRTGVWGKWGALVDEVGGGLWRMGRYEDEDDAHTIFECVESLGHISSRFD